MLRRGRERKLSNEERNRRLIRNPPKPTLVDRYWIFRMRASEVWGRHVRHKELYRLFDSARALMQEREARSAFSDSEGIQRLRAEVHSRRDS